jgi:hypothetical protein
MLDVYLSLFRFAMPSRHRLGAIALLLAASAPQGAWAGGTPATGTTSDQLLMITGSESQTSDGDYLTARDGLATTHRYFVEVPATASRFRLDLFDMDLMMGGATDRTGDRDRPRVYPDFDPNDLGTYSSELFMSVVEYRLFDPDGTAVVAKRRKGSRWAPDGGDNAWLTLYDSNTADTSAATDTWRDNFSTSSFSNNNGTQSFTTSWIESNETGTNSVAGPGGGLVSVTGGAGGVLRMNNLLTPFPPYTGRQPGVERELNLSGYTSATLSFTFLVPSNNEKDDILVVELSNDGGATWTVVDDVTGGIHGIAVAATARIYDISDFISANTRVRFRLAYLFAGANERVDIDNFEIRATTAAPAALKTGHWELRVDMSRALTMNVTVQNGDDTNAFGIRASDGDTTASGTEFNVYSYVNTSGLDDNDSTRSYTLYPLLTSGCDFDAANFDWDADLAANVAPDPDINPPFGTFEVTGRETAFTHTLTTLSNNDDWYSENITGFTDQDDATNYGLWQADFRIDDPGDGNYVPHYYMDYDAATVTPPASNAPADALRNYFPNDAGTVPAKPYIRQFVRFHNVQPTPAAEPPLVGQTARYVIYLQVVNPSGSTGSITFSPTRTVTSRFTGGTMTYQGVALMTQGSIVSQPTLGSTTAGDVVWNPGVVTAGAGGVDNVAQLSYEVDFTPTVSPYLVDFTGAPGSGNGTRATWLDETGYDTVGSRSIFSTGELCQLWEQFDDPTPVLVSSFRGWRKNGQTVVEWQTSAEAKTTSFDLYRSEGRNRVKVNSQTLSALLASPQGGIYRLVDPGAPAPGAAAEYWLEAHDSDGRSQTHGPFRVAADEELAAPMNGAYSVAVHPPSSRHLAFVPPPAPAPVTGPDRGAAPALLIETTERGLYRVGRASLASAFGLSAAQLDARLAGYEFHLERGGQPVAWTPAPGLTGLDFFAPGFENAYTGADVFRLSLGDGLGMRKIDGKALPLDWPGGSFREVRHSEQNLRPVVLLPLEPEGDFFFWDFVRHGTAAETRSFSFELPSPAAGGGPARLLLDLQGGAAGAHQLEVSLNGTPLGVAEVAGKAAVRAELSVAPNLLLAGANSLSVRAAAGDLVFVDAFDLEYDRAYQAAGGRLISRPDGRSLLSAAGFSRPAVRVFDLADPLQPRLLATTRVIAEGAQFRAIWRPLGQNDQLAVEENEVLTPAIRQDSPSDLKDAGNQADYLVISTAALAPAAQGLADLRETRGLVSQVVLLEDIYDEFAFGRRDPRAIRDFLAYAHANWSVPPRYVVLAGHGTYDFRDFLGYHNNLIPSLMWRAGDSLYPTDALYADFLNEDGVPELALGRLPVLTAGELEAYVAKLAAYEALDPAAWQSQVLMLSDASGSGGNFLADSRALSPLLPAGYAATEIALDELDVATARGQLFASLASGAALVHYTGHGAVDRFSSSGLLTSGDVPSLGNAGRPAVVSAVTCHVGFHALPTFDSLGEELVLHPAGGAVAVFAPTWLAENYDSFYLGDRLFRRLFAAQGVLLGDAVAGTLGAAAAQNIDRDLLYAYQLLGDPALLFIAHPVPPPPGCSEDCGNG